MAQIMAKQTCDDAQSPSTFNFILSILILFGIVLSYLPQHWRIIARRSSEGISPFFVLLGTTSGTCAFAAILTLPASQHMMSCCKSVSGYACVSGVLGIAQIGVQWACFIIILLLFLLFFPSATSIVHPEDPKASPTYRIAISVFVICMMHLAFTFILSAYFIYIKPHHLKGWASFTGILGTVLAAIQFLPQIWTTWKLKAVGSLSIPTMCIQTPGSVVWVASLAMRLGWEGWSAWGVYLVTGILQGVLLAMSIVFEIRNKKKSADEHEEDDVNERTHLINNER